MADTIWPFSTGYASRMIGLPDVTPATNVLASDVDAGRPKLRPLRTKSDRIIRCYTVLLGSELATFRTWFDQTCKAGALTFEWYDPETDDSADFQFEGTPRHHVLVGNEDPDYVKWQLDMTLRMLAT